MIGMSPSGPQQFLLPRCDVDIEVIVAGSPEKPVPKLETVLLKPSDGVVCLSWRAALPCDKKTLKVEEVRVQAEAGKAP
jgi:hypothetical protein